MAEPSTMEEGTEASVSGDRNGEPSVAVEVKPRAGGVGGAGGGGGAGRRGRGKRTVAVAPVEGAGGVGGEEEGGEDSSEGGVSAELASAVEAILLSSDRPVSAARIAQVLSDVPIGAAGGEGDRGEEHALAEPMEPAREVGVREVRAAVAELNRQYERTGRSFRVEALAGGHRIMTLPRFGRVLSALHGAKQKASLSRAAVETLAIIAYKQPITRARLEAVRGVSCGEVLRSLTERRLITVAGRAEELGRPMLYATTRQFLEVFGLSSTKDLPGPEEFARRLAEEE
ncbi:MAG: SMC-Scp complex subunit ScpB [Phycisphaeraceae bacterium]|nr:SMC-Scp complex subunit ScpB [Phycisphaeraceae bacterium]